MSLSALPAFAADAPPPEKGKGLSAEERQARREACKADPQKCRDKFKAKREQFCKDNPQRCQEMKERREKRMAECKENPERCKEMKEKMQKRHAEKQAHFEQRFKHADADGNGLISRAEAQQHSRRLARRFDQIDANHDGQVSREEIAAARRVRHELRRQRGQGAAPANV
jgi:hypothetical protein